MALVLVALLAITATNDIVGRFFPPELKVRDGVPIRGNELQQAALYEVLAWSNGAIASAGDADALATFTRGTGAPRPTKYEFSVDDARSARRLVVLNGTPTGASRVSSAVITLNGAPVLTERDFNAKIARREVSVTLTKGDNELGVELRGAPGSQLTIVGLPK